MMLKKIISSNLLVSQLCKVPNIKKYSMFAPSKTKTHVHQFVNIHGRDIGFVKIGKEYSENNIILLPGALGSAWSDFKPQIQQLPELLPNCTIIAWDPPGYGKFRPIRRQFGFDMFEKDAMYAMDLLKALNINQFSILGWSGGGITGMFMAGLYPENVNKLVIWGAAAYVTMKEVKIYEIMKDINKWSSKFLKSLELMYDKKEIEYLWSENADLFKRFLHERNGDICKSILKKIIAPTLILQGAKDTMISSEHGPYLQNHIKNSELYSFDEGQHNIHLRYPEQFNRMIVEFLMKEMDTIPVKQQNF